MGEIVAGDMEAYRYLVESIRKFPNQDDFKSMFQVQPMMLGMSFLADHPAESRISGVHSGKPVFWHCSNSFGVSFQIK